MENDRFSKHLARVMRARRENAKISRMTMAAALQVNVTTVQRLEEGESLGRDIDQTVAVYAYVTGLDDPRALWRQALTAWEQQPTPVFQAEGIAAAFADAIRNQLLR